MHTFLLYVQLTGSNDLKTVEKVRLLLKNSLKLNFESGRILRDHLRFHLPDILNDSFLVWVDAMGKSYFVNISVREKKNIVISALFKSLNTLKDLSAYRLAEILGDKNRVNQLEMPRTLVEEVYQFI